MTETIQRCSWCGTAADYVAYHDNVWGRPVGDSQELFEKLCLDGQQAGLSWLTVLRKQAHYQQAFANFDPDKIVSMPASYQQELMHNAGIIRNRLKIEAIFKNARAYIQLRDSGQAFNEFLWQFSDGQPRIFARTGEIFLPAMKFLILWPRRLKKQVLALLAPQFVTLLCKPLVW